MLNLKEGYGYLKHSSVTESYVMAAFLIIVIISGNFLSETLGCQFQKLLDNMIFKNVLIYFTIYFTIELSSDDSIPENPLITSLKALTVWIIFKFFTRMNLIPTICVILLGITIFIISQYRKFLKYKKEHSEDDDAELSQDNLDENLSLIQNTLFNLIIVVICVSFIVYFIEKRREHKKNFSFLTFLFGVKKCKYETSK